MLLAVHKAKKKIRSCNGLCGSFCINDTAIFHLRVPFFSMKSSSRRWVAEEGSIETNNRSQPAATPIFVGGKKGRLVAY